MAYRKTTLRRMSPTTRQVARLIGEGESVIRRLKNLIPAIQQLELSDKALFNRERYTGGYNESSNPK
jgi:hypothetical protein